MAKTKELPAPPRQPPPPAEHYYSGIQGYFDWPQVYDDAVAFMPSGGTFVEVGCWKGQSLSYLLVEAKNSGKRFRVIGVDHFTGSVNDEPLLNMAKTQDIEAQCRENAARAEYPVEIIRAESPDAAQQFADGSLDYVFIDGSHDTASVLADLRAWLPKVKTGGIIAGHDINQHCVQDAVLNVLGGREIENIPSAPYFPRWGDCWRVKV